MNERSVKYDKAVTYFFDNELGIYFAIGAIVLKCKMATFGALFKFALVPLKILNVNFVPT